MRIAFSLLLASIAALTQAHAVQINVDGTDYEITVMSPVPYLDVESTIQVQPWFSDASGVTARAFINTYVAEIGALPQAAFAWNAGGSSVSFILTTNVFGPLLNAQAFNDTAPWATAEIVSAPDSGSTVLLLGAGLIGLFAIRRRTGRS